MDIGSLREELLDLDAEGSVEVSHDQVRGLVMTVRRDAVIVDFLGIDVRMTNDRYVVSDNDGNVHREHKASESIDDVIAYLVRLQDIETIELFRYVKNMKRYDLEEGDVIEFSDGKRAVVIMPDFDIQANNVLYVPLKKDGSLSKLSPRMLYGSTVFKKIDC